MNAPHTFPEAIPATREPSALERSFADVCGRHGLSAISLNFSTEMPTGNYFSAFVHRDGNCAGEHGDTIAAAIGKALAALNAKDVALADEALPELAA